MKKAILLLTLLCLTVGAFTACVGAKFPIHFVVDGEVYGTVYTSGNEKVSMPKNPVKDGYRFDGWYFDEGTWKEHFTANSLLDTSLSAKIYVYAKWSVVEEEKDPETEKNENTEPTIVISSVKAVKGERNVKVTVGLKNNPGVTSMLMDIRFDNSVIELEKMVYNTALGGETVPNVTNESPLTAYWANNLEDVEGDFTFVTLYFNLSSGISSGDYSISVSYDEDDIFNAEEKNIDFAVINGKITVE